MNHCSTCLIDGTHIYLQMESKWIMTSRIQRVRWLDAGLSGTCYIHIFSLTEQNNQVRRFRWFRNSTDWSEGRPKPRKRALTNIHIYFLNNNFIIILFIILFNERNFSLKNCKMNIDKNYLWALVQITPRTFLCRM